VSATAALLHPGDIVVREGLRGVVTGVYNRTARVVWEHGGGEAGCFLGSNALELQQPHVRVAVTKGMLGYRGWQRQLAVGAALRRLEKKPVDSIKLIRAIGKLLPPEAVMEGFSMKLQGGLVYEIRWTPEHLDTLAAGLAAKWSVIRESDRLLVGVKAWRPFAKRSRRRA